MDTLRILVLAPDASPESISTSLVGYAHAAALARRHVVTLAVRAGYNEDAVRRAAGPFRRVEGVRVPVLDRLWAWSIHRIFKDDYGSHALTAFMYPFVIAFEWRAWRQFRERVRSGEFDAVLRLLPVTSVLPSAFAFLMKGTGTPFVIGPINGGLPWPNGFVQAERQKEWISPLRNCYRWLPFARSSFRRASAIIAGSSHTCAEFDRYREKVFFVPENGIDEADLEVAPRPRRQGGLRLIFVGRLVPYKGCDLAIRGSADRLRRGRGELTIVGDGVERASLEALTRSLGIEDKVRFVGWVPHAETLERLRRSDVLVFPSLREFGGGVVFEALAMGVVPVVAAFGGPGDIVNASVGYSVRLTNERDLIGRIQSILGELDRDRGLLQAKSHAAMQFAKVNLTWDGKAEAVTRILAWAVGRGPKPDLQPPDASGASAGAVARLQPA